MRATTGWLVVREKKVGDGTRLPAFEKVVEIKDFGDAAEGHRPVADGFGCLTYVLGGERQGTPGRAAVLAGVREDVGPYLRWTTIHGGGCLARALEPNKRLMASVPRAKTVNPW